MFKVSLIVAVALVACVSAQEVAIQEAAPEPYSYGYQTETHAASEQRDPQGKVTGFYMLVGDDGRERRVEYIADEAGFRAKVATNEVGTKSSAPADVEVIASEPTPAQYTAVYQQAAPVPQVQYVAPKPVAVQQTVVARAPQVATTTLAAPLTSSVAYRVAQPQSGYYATNAGYGINRAYYGQAGYGLAGYGNGYNSGAYYGAYAPGYAYGASNAGLLGVGNYNNHLPSQYYRSVSNVAGATVAPAAAGYTVGNSVRYISQPAAYTSGYRTVGSYPAAAGVTYTSGYGLPAGVNTAVRGSNLAGSSNYIVLKKRAAVDAKKA